MTTPAGPLFDPDASPSSIAAALAGVSAALLNQRCACIRLDPDALREALHAALDAPDLFALLQARCPHLFAAHPVFVDPLQLERMAGVIAAVESVVALPAWREHALAHAPATVRGAPDGARGVFFGYDFHVADDSLGLIEINTNAGGAMLNALAARAHRACCPQIDAVLPPAASAAELEARILAMFRREWTDSGHTRPLRSIAIVDADPAAQYLYPEFLLFQRLFQRAGWQTVIADPSELQLVQGELRHGDLAIDLVYNRLTDFALETPASATLLQAWHSRAAVVTPHPLAHALYADKRNLVALSDDATLRALGVPGPTRDRLLASIPRTEPVVPAHAERLWRERRGLFFKPCAGYGSRAAYRGDKLTQRVWQEILAGDYVAQALRPPGERLLPDGEDNRTLKFDVRNYAYAGTVQWVAARLYQGQTTNFRTPGGGFAPVYPGPVATT